MSPERAPRKHFGKPPGSRPAGDDRQTRWKFGQNFLVDEGVIRDICEDVPSNPSDWIVEIGPGQGALTRRLAPRCRKLTAIEIDPKWVEHLRSRPEWGNLEVVQADATRVDWPGFLASHAPEPGARPLLVGNLPYNRAAPILLGLLPHLHLCQSLQIMVQFEVAKRICASPHSRDFGFLSVMAQNRARAEFLRKVSPEAFRPRPKVASATLRLTPRPEPVSTDPGFKPFVDLAFSRRRKMLSNVLEPVYGKAGVARRLQELGLRIDSRAEDLSVEEFAALFQRLGPIPARGGREAEAGASADLPQTGEKTPP